jgi:tripartite-type tricarboxylate transporter receptor subunit TctC
VIARPHTHLATAALAAATALLATPAQAADVYAGKTIDFLVGGDVGGGYDIYARAVSRHLARFIPGNPIIVVKNQPGAGSKSAIADLLT